MPNLGKVYNWSGGDHTLGAAGDKWILNSSGSLITSASGRTNESAADWIVSDDLSSYSRCSGLITATKTTGAAASALIDNFDLHAYGAYSLSELSNFITSGSGEQPIFIAGTTAWEGGCIGVANAVNTTFISAIAQNKSAATTFRFASDPAGGGIINPFRYVAVVIFTHFSGDATGHGWQFKWQWVYE